MRVVIGMGNAYRQDDGVGPVVARRVRQLAGETATVVEVAGGALELLDLWDGVEKVVVIDAVVGAQPGAIHRFALQELDGIQFAGGSTHSLGLAEGVRLGRVLDRLPGELVVFGIEGIAFGHGTALTNRVAAAVESAARCVLEEILCTNTPSPKG